MSTRSLIARATGEGTFKGVYHHWDGYPTGLGKYLTEILAGPFAGDLPRMLGTLIDEHPAGWSTIVGKDFTLKPGYTAESLTHPCSSRMSDADYHAAMQQFRALPDFRRPQCYCHGNRREEVQALTERDDVGAEWAYVFDLEERILHVCNREKHPDTNEFFWNDVARIDLDSVNEVNWTHVECGEQFERCGHYAWKHFPKLEGKSNLGMQTFLGRRPFQMHDAIGFIVNGKRVKNTGSGGDANFLRRSHNLPPLPPNTWVATVVYENGRRADVAVALRTPEGEKPYPGVAWIFPPTLVSPEETVVG
jgi:hypothetical protein